MPSGFQILKSQTREHRNSYFKDYLNHLCYYINTSFITSLGDQIKDISGIYFARCYHVKAAKEPPRQDHLVQAFCLIT